MKFELTIYELGKLLKKVDTEFKLQMFTIVKLSGGWLTMMGDADVEEIPQQYLLGCSTNSNNIINIRIKDDNELGSILKITGAKDKKFEVDISPSTYKEIIKGNINHDEVKINDKECKIRIDSDIIFKVNAQAETIIKLIQK